MMKSYKCVSALFLLGLFTSFTTLADVTTALCSGKAYIPSWSKHYVSSTQYSYVQFSNISNAEITVQIELFDESGNLYTEATETGTQIYIQGDNLVGSPLATSTATLSAQSTGILRVWYTGVEHFGYGVIRWDSTDSECSDESMVASFLRVMSPSGVLAESQIPINSGLPF